VRLNPRRFARISRTCDRLCLCIWHSARFPKTIRKKETAIIVRMSILSPSAQKIQNLLNSLGYTYTVIEHADSTRTAQEAADRAGCELGQIVKSFSEARLHTNQFWSLPAAPIASTKERSANMPVKPSAAPMPISCAQLPASRSEACLPSVIMKKWKPISMRISCNTQPSGRRLEHPMQYSNCPLLICSR
jgi:signal recognition particle subunit SEC65